MVNRFSSEYPKPPVPRTLRSESTSVQYQRRDPPLRADPEASGRYSEVAFGGRTYQRTDAESTEPFRYRPARPASGDLKSNHGTREGHRHRYLRQEKEHNNFHPCYRSANRDPRDGYDQDREHEQRPPPRQGNSCGGKMGQYNAHNHAPAWSESDYYSYNSEHAPPPLIEIETSEAPAMSSFEDRSNSPRKTPPQPSYKPQEPSRKQRYRYDRRSLEDQHSSRVPPNPPASDLASRSQPPTPPQSTMPYPSPSSDMTVEVAPGVRVRVRGSAETWNAIGRDFFVPCRCLGCESTVCVIQDAEFVLCPLCRVVSPVSAMEDERGSGSGGGGGGGVGLGFMLEELAVWQNDIATSNQHQSSQYY